MRRKRREWVGCRLRDARGSLLLIRRFALSLELASKIRGNARQLKTDLMQKKGKVPREKGRTSLPKLSLEMWRTDTPSARNDRRNGVRWWHGYNQGITWKFQSTPRYPTSLSSEHRPPNRIKVVFRVVEAEFFVDGKEEWPTEVCFSCRYWMLGYKFSIDIGVIIAEFVATFLIVRVLQGVRRRGWFLSTSIFAALVFPTIAAT